MLCVAGALALLTGAQCRGAEDADAVASRFVDAYYVEFDLAAAKALAEGGAVARLESEQKLVADARAKTSIQEARARVYYQSPQRHPVGEDMVHYTYAIEVRDGHQQIALSAVLMLGRRGEVWRVMQFREEAAPGMPGANIRTSTAGRAAP